MTKGSLPIFLLICMIQYSSPAGPIHRGGRAHAPQSLTNVHDSKRLQHQTARTHAFSSCPGDSLARDWQHYGTNGSASHNIVSRADGSVEVGRMIQPDSGGRGTWYAYSEDGQTWPPLRKIEEGTTGWGNLDYLPEVGSSVTVSHPGLTVYVFNEAAWASSSTGGSSLWPRLAAVSDLHIHIVSSFGPGIGTGQILSDNVVYTRSTDAGGSFDIVDSRVFSSTTKSDADGYDIAAQGSNVAIVSAGAGGDVVLLQSTDDGDNWVEHIIYDVRDGIGELPTGEEEFQPDGSCALVFDHSGGIHIVWSTFLGVGNADSTAELYYSIAAPIMYWNENVAPAIIAYPTQDTTIGNPPYGRDGNYASEPDIGVMRQMVSTSSTLRSFPNAIAQHRRISSISLASHRRTEGVTGAFRWI